jgi:predicted amidohydrolase
MFTTGFSMNIAAVAEREQGETAAFLSDRAKKYGIWVIGGFPAEAPGGTKGRNLALVMDRRGKRAARYEKIHPFSLLREEQSYLQGDRTEVFQIDGIPSSLFICYDLRFPEIFRAVARRVQAIFIVANWPTARKDHWLALAKARAIENQCFIIAVNRTGRDGNGIDYPGASCIFDPLGREICLGSATEEYLTGVFEPARVHSVRKAFPFLNDMRPWSLE